MKAPFSFIKSGAAPFDPATLSLEAWWQAGNYSVSLGTGTWTGSASAGSSGSRSLSEATNPPTAGGVGGTLNGYNVAVFARASSQKLVGAVLSTYFAAGAYSGWVLFKANSQAADNANPNLDDCLLSETNGYFALGERSTGPTLILQHDDGTQKRATATFSNSAYQLVRFRKSTSDIEISVNSGGWTTTGAGNLGNLGGTLNVGCEFNRSLFFDGTIADIGLTSSSFSDSTFDNVKSYINSRYALSL